jgi:tetratricopeptide (TPR) repeat protein
MKDDFSALPFKGTFSLTTKATIGTGTTTQRVKQTHFFYAERLPGDSVEIQPLNSNFCPSGPKQQVLLDEFLSNFMPEPDLHHEKVAPQLKLLRQTLARGDRHRAREEFFSAEMEYGKVLKVDEENVRANFGLGLCFLERDDKDKAIEVFGRLVKLKAAFDPEHKHLFNEFGISLRKSRLHRQSLLYYSKALSLSQQDENLYYNVARVLHEVGREAGAGRMLRKALEINPAFSEGKTFLAYLASVKS